MPRKTQDHIHIKVKLKLQQAWPSSPLPEFHLHVVPGEEG